MKKIIFYSLEEYFSFIERFKTAIVTFGKETKKLYVVVKDYIVAQLIEDEGFEVIDFKPVFVQSLQLVENIRSLAGNPKGFYYRYFPMKGQYLVTC